MNKVLVTGGTGYIGSHTVVELYKSGYEVVIVDDLSNSDESTLDRIHQIVGKKPLFYKIDLCKMEEVKTIFDENEITSIIHFAASKAVGESVSKPLLYYRNNLISTINILEMMVLNKVYSLIFSSSCTVYGEPDYLPVDENSPVKAASSPYGNTKQICEEIINDAVVANTNLKSISLRYFNPIGAHESGLLGEVQPGTPNNLMPYLLKVAEGELEELSVFGNDYQTHDGTCIRDYIHVMDLAKAHVIALNRLLDNSNESDYEVFNLGTGEGYSVLDIINTFEKVTNQKVKYQVVDRRAGDIEKIYANTHLANEKLGWKAQYGLDQMLSSAWKWQKEQGKKY